MSQVGTCSHRLPGMRSAFLLILAAALTIRPARAEPLTIENGLLRVGFDEQRGTLSEFTDLDAQHNHVRMSRPGQELWSLLATQDGQPHMVRAADAQSFQCEQDPAAEARIRLTWSGFTEPAMRDLKVMVTITLEPERPLSRWKIVVEKPPAILLKRIHFPTIGEFTPQENEFLAVPVWTGAILADPRKTLCDPESRPPSWHYPGALAMQCLTYYRQDGPGFYAACDDTAAFWKTFSVWGAPTGEIHFEIVHYPEAAADGLERYALPYDVLLGALQGDWFTAAEWYRGWAIRQPWAERSRLKTGRVPDWVVNTGAWVWNRGRSEGVLGPAAVLKQELGAPISVLWHWWHGCPYDIGFPEYLPPREGADAFHAAVARARQRDIHALVYMNQRAWGTSTQSWKEQGAERFAVKEENGKFREEVYNTFTGQALAPMCLATSFWRDTYADLAERAFKTLGVSGIYMDQACHSLPCYDPSHGHALGGGNYWVKGFETLAREIRRRCDNKRQIALAGEGCGEPWLPYLDLMLTLQASRERYASLDDPWEIIPFFHAVYHPYAILFGSYSSLTVPPYDELWPAEFAPKEPLALLDRKFSQQFYLEQARAFVWGQQPTIANFLPSQLDSRPEEIQYFKRLVTVRLRAEKYLMHGAFLRPPELNPPQTTSEFSRLSIYAGQQDRVKSRPKQYPLVLSGVWLAPDGDVGVALTNISEESLDLELKLHPNQYPLASRRYLYRIEESGRSYVGPYVPSESPIALSLPPRDACIVELSSKPPEALVSR